MVCKPSQKFTPHSTQLARRNPFSHITPITNLTPQPPPHLLLHLPSLRPHNLNLHPPKKPQHRNSLLHNLPPPPFPNPTNTYPHTSQPPQLPRYKRKPRLPQLQFPRLRCRRQRCHLECYNTDAAARVGREGGEVLEREVVGCPAGPVEGGVGVEEGEGFGVDLAGGEEEV